MENNNNHNIKLCPNCGAKNKAAYKYCNDCGTPLDQTNYKEPGASSAPPFYGNISPNQPPYGGNGNQYPPYVSNPYYTGQFGQGGYTPYPPNTANMNAPYVGTPDFDGVSAKDVYDFTGEKAVLFNKLRIQHFSGKSGPYCWSLFVLGLVLGFFGMGCWYLYHKMYKPAIGFLAAGAVEIGVKLYTIYIMFDLFTKSVNERFVDKILNSGGFDLNGMEDELLGSGGLAVSVLDYFADSIRTVTLLLAIILPFFAYKHYKNYALRKIRFEYTKSPMPDIKAAGGSKGGLVATASVIYAVIYLVVLCISVFPFVDKLVKTTEQYIENNPGSYYIDDYEQLPFNDGGLEFDDGSGDIW